MFNLLVQYPPWAADRDTVSLGRIFEYTDSEVKARFESDGRPLLNKLVELPCIFMREGRGDELAYVGKINRARTSGLQVTIEYTLDPAIPPLKNSVIYDQRVDFDIAEDFEFSRTHWAVKDADLYHVLLRNQYSRRQRPTVFVIPEHEQIEPALVSVMMPFDATFKRVYKGVKETAERINMRCRRADEIWESPAIIQDIVSLIDKSRVVICDCTGRNPNVFYEIGIAHTLGREVILITQNEADIPFDLRHLRYVHYLNNAEGRRALFAALESRLNGLLGN